MKISPSAQIVSGAVLCGAAWSVAWFGPEPARFHTFFPLWLGYIVLVDGATRQATDTSLMERMHARFALLFLISVPIWWLFEAANARLENWVYVLPHTYSWLAYHLEASLAFSTVLPAIFVTAELVRSAVCPRTVHWIALAPPRSGLMVISGGGFLIFAATMIWPGQLFPFLWLSLFFAIDPIVELVGGRSINGPIRSGRWDTVIVLFIATLICGALWEFWNFWSTPKWTYEIPYADWMRIFEMPAMGYGGYLPFGLEVYALFALVDRLFSLGLGSHIRFGRGPRISDSVQRSYAVRDYAD